MDNLEFEKLYGHPPVIPFYTKEDMKSIFDEEKIKKALEEYSKAMYGSLSQFLEPPCR